MTDGVYFHIPDRALAQTAQVQGRVRLINAMRARLSIAMLQYSDNSKVIVTNRMIHLIRWFFNA